MNPVMKIAMEVAINVSTEDDTAAASEHSDSRSVYTDIYIIAKINDNNNIIMQVY